MERESCDLFEYAPISLWEEDYSAVKQYLDQVRAAGVTDFRAYLDAHPQAVADCLERIRVLNVNRQTVLLFRAASRQHLLDNVSRIFRDEMGRHFADELVDMFNGARAYVREGVNYTLDGEPLDIRLHWAVMPEAEATWARVLVSIEDITPRRRAERQVAASEARFRGLFEHAPVSLWEEDYTALKRRLDGLREQGVTDLAEYIQAHSELVAQCMGDIRVVDVNERTLGLFRASSRQELLDSLPRIFRDEMGLHFTAELLDMWAGKLAYEREGVNYALNGDPINIQLQWTVLPGAEEDFSRVLVSIQDITARKQAEDYLKYLGTHDVLTGLYNRTYYEEELARLGRGRHWPVSIVIADLDGLKTTNDTRGHAEGDKLIRRAAEVLAASVRAEDVVARIGGDEFAALLPATDAAAALQAVARIHALVELNNKYHQTPTLSLSIGSASGVAGTRLPDVMREADDAMYVEKRGRSKRITAGQSST
jgi:diguanylate cyclase (GGDEF)-like protein